jgi:hypothetical protein
MGSGRHVINIVVIVGCTVLLGMFLYEEDGG